MVRIVLREPPTLKVGMDIVCAAYRIEYGTHYSKRRPSESRTLPPNESQVRRVDLAVGLLCVLWSHQADAVSACRKLLKACLVAGCRWAAEVRSDQAARAWIGSRAKVDASRLACPNSELAGQHRAGFILCIRAIAESFQR